MNIRPSKKGEAAPAASPQGDADAWLRRYLAASGVSVFLTNA